MTVCFVELSPVLMVRLLVIDLFFQSLYKKFVDAHQICTSNTFTEAEFELCISYSPNKDCHLSFYFIVGTHADFLLADFLLS